MGKKKKGVSAFETGCGSRNQAHRFETGCGSRNQAHRFECVKNCNAAGFFTLNSFLVCIKNGPPPKRHPANLTQLWEALESTWASIPVERFQHLVESNAPQRIEAGILNVLYTQCIYCFMEGYFVVSRNLF